MDTVKTLHYQTKDAYKWARRLIESIPKKKWDEIPTHLETNVTWQIGHLLMSFNYHSVMVIKGHQIDLYNQFPVKQYAELFTELPVTECVGKTDPRELFKHFRIVQERSLSIIESLTEEDLEQSLESTRIKHPIARTKLQALDWNIKHTMWHCGQLGMLKRVLDKRMDFGLK